MPVSTEKYSGPTNSEHANRICEIYNQFGQDLEYSELKELKQQARKILNPSLEDMPVPRIEKGVHLSTLFNNDVGRCFL